MKEECEKKGIAKTPYTTLEFSNIKQMHAELVAKLAARKRGVKEEIDKQAQNDGVCGKFADIAAALLRDISNAMNLLTKSDVC